MGLPLFAVFVVLAVIAVYVVLAVFAVFAVSAVFPALAVYLHQLLHCRNGILVPPCVQNSSQGVPVDAYLDLRPALLHPPLLLLLLPSSPPCSPSPPSPAPAPPLPRGPALGPSPEAWGPFSLRRARSPFTGEEEPAGTGTRVAKHGGKADGNSFLVSVRSYRRGTPITRLCTVPWVL